MHERVGLRLTLSNAAVDEKHESRPDYGSEDACALTRPVEADEPAQEGADERPSHAQERCHEEPSRI